MLWRVQYKKAMGLVRGTASAPNRDAAIERALRLFDDGYAVVAVGTDAHPSVFNANDINRLFAHHRSQQAA
jgi:hypothetical protein